MTIKIGRNGLYQIDLEHQVMVTSVHHKRYVKLRSILKELRLKSGLTQIQIADLLSMEQSNVSKIERGERYIDTLFFIDYCKACGAVPADVIAKVDDSEDQTF